MLDLCEEITALSQATCGPNEEAAISIAHLYYTSNVTRDFAFCGVQESVIDTFADIVGVPSSDANKLRLISCK